MKASENRLSQTGRDSGETLVRSRIDALFRSLPMLCGFVVEQDLLLTDLTVSAWPGHTAGPDLYRDIADALAELVDERPEAMELLRGRTFARQVH